MFTVQKISPRAGFKLGPLVWICYYKTSISINVNWYYFAKSQSVAAESIMQVGRSFALTAL